jgi:hypothetical protein
MCTWWVYVCRGRQQSDSCVYVCVYACVHVFDTPTQWHCRIDLFHTQARTVCVCMYVCTCIRVCIYIYIYVCVCVVYVCIHGVSIRYMHLTLCLYVCTCVRIYIYIYMYIYMVYVCVYACLWTTCVYTLNADDMHSKYRHAYTHTNIHVYRACVTPSYRTHLQTHTHTYTHM